MAVVECVWVGRWDLRRQPPHISRLLGDPSVHLVFEQGDRVEQRVVGVWTRLWERRLEGCGRVVGVKLRPGAVAAAVAVPAHTLTDGIHPMAPLVADSAAIAARLSDSAHHTRLADEVCAWFRAIRRDDAGIAEAVTMASRVVEQRDVRRVEDLAAAHHCSVRHVQRVFRHHVGASPKWMIGRVRLQDAAAALEQGRTTIARVAADLGYADQAHFSRDFRRHVGYPPGELAAVRRFS